MEKVVGGRFAQGCTSNLVSSVFHGKIDEIRYAISNGSFRTKTAIN